MPTTDIELQCVGNAINLAALCQVEWLEFLENGETKRAAILSRSLPVKRHRRENRINFVTYECEEGVNYHYRRYVCVKPQTYEEKWFKMENGEFIITGKGDGNQLVTQFTTPFEKQCAAKGIYSNHGHGRQRTCNPVHQSE
jgi:hypothetical protein